MSGRVTITGQWWAVVLTAFLAIYGTASAAVDLIQVVRSAGSESAQ